MSNTSENQIYNSKAFDAFIKSPQYATARIVCFTSIDDAGIVRVNGSAALTKLQVAEILTQAAAGLFAESEKEKSKT